MATNDVGIRVGVEGEKQFRDSLKGINSQLKNLNTEMQASTREFEKNAGSQEALNRKAEILGKTIDVEKQKVELLTKQYENQNKKLSALGEELDKVSEEFGKNSEQAGKAQNAYNRQATEVNKLGSQLNAAKSDLSRFEEEMQQTTIQSDKLVSGLKNASDRLGKFSSKASSIGNTLTLGLTTPILAAGTASFKFASDLNENLNKTEVAFGKNSDDVVKWSKTTLKQYGLAQSTALEMAATWGDMGTSMELPLDTATEMSQTLVGLAADMASFKNISIDRAQTALNAVYTGETESLKELGVVMTQANLEAYAMSKGIEKSYQDMTEAEKVTLRYQYVLDKTQNSQGDFARTSDSAANQMRIAQESAKELAAEFGQKLLPAGTKILEFANDLLDGFNNLDDGTQQLIIGLGGIVAAAGPVTKIVGGITGAASKVTSGIGNLIEKVKGLDDSSKNSKNSVGDLVEQVVGLDGATKNADTSTGKLGKALSSIASPTGGAIALAVGAFGLYMGWLGDVMFKENEYIELSKKKNEQLDKQIEASRQLSEETEKRVGEIQSEADYYKSLYEEMDLLVDANGRVKEGYEDRVSYILGELSEAYGIESELVNGVVTDYEKLKQSIEESSKSSMAQKLLEEYDDDYADAIKNISATEQAMNDYRLEVERLQEEYDKLVRENTDSMGRFFGDYAQLHELGQNLESAKGELEKYTADYQKYQSIIDRVDSARMATMQGNYQEAIGILDDTIDQREEAAKSLYQIGLEELNAERERNKSLLEEYERTGSESVKLSLDASNERIADLEKSLVESIQTVDKSKIPYMTVLKELANAGSKGYAENLDFEAPTLEQVSLLEQAMQSSKPVVSSVASSVAQSAVAGMTSENPNAQKAGAELIKQFSEAMAMEEGPAKDQALAIAGTVAAALDVRDQTEERGKKAGEAFLTGMQAALAVSAVQAAVSGVLGKSRSASPTTYAYSSPVPTSRIAALSTPVPAAALSVPGTPETGAVRAVRALSLFPDISQTASRAAYDAGREIALAIERRIAANINPARQEIAVALPKGSAGTTLNQTNNFYSPEALSPAETARLNRQNVRRTIQALR